MNSKKHFSITKFKFSAGRNIPAKFTAHVTGENKYGSRHLTFTYTVQDKDGNIKDKHLFTLDLADVQVFLTAFQEAVKAAQTAADTSPAEWLARQQKALTTETAQDAIRQLEKMGYSVVKTEAINDVLSQVKGKGRGKKA